MPRYPKLRYYLANPKMKTSGILAAVYVSKKRVCLSTGIAIETRLWNTERQRLKISVTGAGIINAELDAIADAYRVRIFELRRRHITPTPEIIENILRAVVGGSYGGTIVADLERYIEARRIDCTEGTLKVYKAIADMLRRFEQYRGAVLSYEMLTAEMLRELFDYMLNVEGYQNSTLRKVLKRLRTFLRWARLNGFGDASALDVPLRIPEGDRIERAYLRLDELERVRTAPLTGKHAVVRDLFVLQCYTGLRWSDLQRLRRSMYDDASREIVLVTQKTRKAIRVPLLPEALEILERYDWTLPQWSNAYQNRLLKEALRACGITEPVEVIEYRGATRVVREVPKCDAISTHAAKRTFVSVLVARGVSLETVCRVTGNTRATIEAYIHKDQTELRAELQRAFESPKLPQ
ncbi:MAG: tyrosine-type recombinase/integrase [Chlorobi bacterium]|nr:tyrosine-type recombinase/integrase [Chlorobiota bacterium]